MRKTKVVTIASEGRDNGKQFLITEMSAVAAEKWATRALLALSRNGAEVSDEALQAGAVAILSAGLAGFRHIAFGDLEPLLDDMMTCVAVIPDATRVEPLTGNPVSRPLVGGDVEEVPTLLLLRSEVLEVHLGFSVRDALSNLAASASRNSQVTPTSRKRSAKSSGGSSPPSTSAKPSMV